MKSRLHKLSAIVAAFFGTPTCAYAKVWGFIFDRIIDIYLTRDITKDRQHRFLRKHADLYERIPKKELATYLNISAETLSRLKHQGKI